MMNTETVKEARRTARQRRGRPSTQDPAGAAARGNGQAGVPPASARKRPAAGTPGRSLRLTTAATVPAPALEIAVAAHLPPGKRLALVLTDNRYSMVTVRRKPEGYAVRAHRMFEVARPRVLRALARYIVHNDPRASRALGDFIRENEHVIKQQPRQKRQVRLRPVGRHHDLQRIFDLLNDQRFGGKLQARITWGPGSRRPSPGQKSIKMGSFSIEDRIIRIHPVLDHAMVPEYFVAWIVFHEMLHGKHQATRVGNRRCYHTRAFVEEEQSFEHYDRACAWERANIERLLRDAASQWDG